MTIDELRKAAPLLNLAEVSRRWAGEQVNPRYWPLRLERGAPEIRPEEAKALREALEPIGKLFKEVE